MTKISKEFHLFCILEKEKL